MLKKLNFHLIKIFFLSAIISQDFIPNNGDLLNYNQIFFKWPQINNINYYRISLIDTDGIQERYFTDINSIVIDNLSWNNQYSWDVCGYDGEDNLIDCHNQFNFLINSLPENYPININVLQRV